MCRCQTEGVCCNFLPSIGKVPEIATWDEVDFCTAVVGR